MTDKLMQLINDLHKNDMELVQFWKDERDFWKQMHTEKDKRYWAEREKRLTAEYLLKETEDATR